MKRIFLVYLLAYALVMVILAQFFVYPKAELHLMLNGCHTPAGDIFFRYYSTLAEWPLYLVGLIPLFCRRWRWTLFFGLSEGIAALVVQAVKFTFRAPRPVVFFEDYPDLQLPLVEGVTLHHSNSFPSGHTNSFFVFFTVAALLLSWYLSRRKAPAMSGLLLLPLLFLAFLGGYSRIYLSQHFFTDVYVGSLIGITVPCLLFWAYHNKITQPCKKS